jgi:hypothetical protein
VTGYTAILCAAPQCRVPRLAARLGDTVGASGHGVLVISGCTVGGPACRTRAPGAMLVVQPCDTARRPTGPAIHVGPIEPADVDVVAAWLARTPLDPDGLPTRLTGLRAGSVAN